MLDIETDPFAQLLAEALRAGPGSAAWRDAVAQLGTLTDGADEYQALLAARENLESGKPYRAIHAGAGFTRKVMEELDRQDKPGASRGIPTAPIIAVLAAIGIICALGWLGAHLMPKADDQHGELNRLASTYFSTDVATQTFSGPISAQWREIGGLGLDMRDGLRPGPDFFKSPGGGVALATPLSGDEPFDCEAELRLEHPSEAAVAQVFISTSGDFSDDRATSSHELIWSLRGRLQQVVLDGRVVTVASSALHDGIVHVRIAMDRDQAVVELDGQRLWGGAHGLGAGPRWVGVRFIRSAPAPDAGIQIRSLNVLKR